MSNPNSNGNPSKTGNKNRRANDWSLRTPVFLLLVLALFAQSLYAQSQPRQIGVRVKPGFSTVVVCPAPPDLVTVGNPDDYAVQNTGKFLLIKPLVTRGSTNMFIKVGAETYHLILKISDTADLEVRLGDSPLASKNPSLSNGGRKTDGASEADRPPATVKLSATRDLRPVLKKARSILPAYLSTPRRYAFSIKDSNVILALDYMVQIQDKLFVLCTLVNNSNIPYDIGYVRFKLIDQVRSFIFFKKKIKESELEPIREVYKQRIHPKTASRMVFIFDKHGFSDSSKLQIKCIEESGRRDLVLEAPASYVE